MAIPPIGSDQGGILATLQQGVRAINALVQKVGTVFPVSGGTATSATAGSATLPANPAKFLIVTLPDGTVGKVPVYNE